MLILVRHQKMYMRAQLGSQMLTGASGGGWIVISGTGTAYLYVVTERNCVARPDQRMGSCRFEGCAARDSTRTVVIRISKER